MADEQQQEIEGFFDFDIQQFRHREARSYGLRRTSYHLRVRNPPETRPIGHGNIIREFEEGSANAIDRLIEELPDEDRIQIYLGSRRLSSAHTSAHVSVHDWRESLDPARQVLDVISRMLNSNENFDVDDTMELDLTHISMPSGSGSSKRKSCCLGTDNYEDFLKKKQCVVRIQNRDELCCARAIVTAKSNVDNDQDRPNLNRGYPIQKMKAEELHEQAGVPLGPCGLDEIKQFETILPDYQFVVVSAEHGHSIIHKGPEKDKQIILLMHDNHFEVIKSLPAFFSRGYFCIKCEKGFNTDDLQHHRCYGTKCFACHQTDCTDFALRKHEMPDVTCSYCQRRFYGVICQTNHMLRTSSGQTANHQTSKNVCATERVCSECGRKKEGRHKCGESPCPSCNKMCNLEQHKCFIQSVEMDEDETDRQNKTHPIFIYFDIEARQDTGQHVANLVCAETDEDDTQYSFTGEKCVEDFLKWVQGKANKKKISKAIVVAHNFKGYDGYMILEELYRQHATNINLIVNGAKILSIDLPQIKFIDSMNFFPMALSNFPKTFGLHELKKGFFPHFFNTVENQDYVGPIPEVKFYDPDGMSPSRKEEFLKWHEQKVKENYHFDFQQELLTYCQSDVRLLKEGCMNFQREFKSITEFNPMRNCITIASACNVAYRKNWLPKNKLAVEPMQGWRPSNTQSHAALEWLYWEEQRLDKNGLIPRIGHAGNSGERRLFHGLLNDFLVDGYDKETNTVYEFQGCFYHGCLKCYPNRMQRHPKQLGKTMHVVRMQTMEKVMKMESLGYKVVEMWECKWNKLKRDNNDIASFVAKLDIVSPLNPRDAFFGGRTNAIKLYEEIDKHEEIHYMDITSLYPFVNKNAEYPVGHPEFIDQPDTVDISNYFGLVKCKIVPPYELYHPVLPYRHDGKLTFPLCRKCVEEGFKQTLHDRTPNCHHNKDERAFVGTWCTPELNKALEKGYEITYIYEVWHFKEKSTELFKEYINTFLKLKQEASGWPDECNTSKAKQEYMDNYYSREKITLTNVCKNAGKRSLAKLMLNSFWGKFGQRSNQTQVTTCKKPSEFYELVKDDSQEIRHIEIINEHMVEVFHKYQSDCDPVQLNVNIFIACFTTCNARLELYKALDMLNERVLYFDTDSVVYKWKPGLPKIESGNYLGEFTSELDKDEHIKEFVAAGAKNYAYITNKGKTCCKIRGFTLNTRGQQILNFNSMKDLVLNEILEPDLETRTLTLHNPYKIQREAATRRIKTITQDKQYKLVFDKRVLDLDEYNSYPYGFQQCKICDH